MRAVTVAVVAVVSLGACRPEPIVPEDYATTFIPVNACVNSTEHDLHHVLVWVSPDDVDDYRRLVDQVMCGDGTCTMPEGAMIVKEEFAGSDPTCKGEIVAWAAMRKESAAMNDWTFQGLAPGFHDNGRTDCARCHVDMCWIDLGWRADATCLVDR